MIGLQNWSKLFKTRVNNDWFNVLPSLVVSTVFNDHKLTNRLYRAQTLYNTHITVLRSIKPYGVNDQLSKTSVRWKIIENNSSPTDLKSRVFKYTCFSTGILPSSHRSAQVESNENKRISLFPRSPTLADHDPPQIRRSAIEKIAQNSPSVLSLLLSSVPTHPIFYLAFGGTAGRQSDTNCGGSCLPGSALCRSVENPIHPLRIDDEPDEGGLSPRLVDLVEPQVVREWNRVVQLWPSSGKHHGVNSDLQMSTPLIGPHQEIGQTPKKRRRTIRLAGRHRVQLFVAKSSAQEAPITSDLVGIAFCVWSFFLCWILYGVAPWRVHRCSESVIYSCVRFFLLCLWSITLSAIG